MKAKKAMKVLVYTTPTCTFCHLAKEFLKEHKVKFEEMDVSKDKKALDTAVKKSGQVGVPVIDINSHILVGFDRVALKRALDL